MSDSFWPSLVASHIDTLRNHPERYATMTPAEIGLAAIGCIVMLAAVAKEMGLLK